MRTKSLIAGLAALALALVGCGGDDAPAVTGDGTSVEIVAGDMFYEPENVSANAGTIEITLINEGAAEHNLLVEEVGDVLVVHTDPGETATGTIDLEPGTYTIYCDIPGHRASGMEGTLTVN
jgi:plastocyanin